MDNNDQGKEPFPSFEEPAAPSHSAQKDDIEAEENPRTGQRSATVVGRAAASSSLSSRFRKFSQSFGQSDLPGGFSAATGSLASSIFSTQAVPDAKHDGARPHPVPNSRRIGTDDRDIDMEAIQPIQQRENRTEGGIRDESTLGGGPKTLRRPTAAAPFPNGYHFPPRHTFGQSSRLAALALWKYTLTPVGFFVVVYGLNVVAWGGMLFLLLCNASPAMCHPTCNDINSPRRKWIEWDSQILNALFCVTGFGLAPWRFRDLWFLLQYRLAKDTTALRRLAGIHRGWFRLPGSTELPIDLGPSNAEVIFNADNSLPVPFPLTQTPDPPLTGVRARSTKLWKLDLVIWLMVMNTLLQCVLCGFMWGMNRYNRPSWATGVFVGLACCVAAFGGLVMFLEGKAVKGVEGVPLSPQDQEQLNRDQEQGIWHYNNIDDKDLRKKEKEKQVR